MICTNLRCRCIAGSEMTGPSRKRNTREFTVCGSTEALLLLLKSCGAMYRLSSGDGVATKCMACSLPRCRAAYLNQCTVIDERLAWVAD